MKQEGRKYAREGDQTTQNKPLGPPAGKLHQLARSSGSSKLARHLASVLIKVGNQFGGQREENGSEILMAAG